MRFSDPMTPSTHVHPIDWARGELGQKEVMGEKDNARIRSYHAHSANIGSQEHPDEVPWCSSFLNAAADNCGMEKTDNALAASWINYPQKMLPEDWRHFPIIDEGDIIVIGTRHVTLANRPFNIQHDDFFEGLGGNQGDMVKVSKYLVSEISAVRKWTQKPGTVTRPIMTEPTPIVGKLGESTR